MKPWEHLDSSTFVIHIRSAMWGALTDANTQPFLRTWSRRDWLFAHSGSLQHTLDIPSGALFEPVGSTDSERIFCDFMGRMADKGWHTLGDADPSVMAQWFAGLNELGGLTCVVSDGRDLLAYTDRVGPGLWLGEFRAPYQALEFGDDALGLNLSRPGNRAHKGIVLTSNPLVSSDNVKWRLLPPAHLCVIRGGSVIAEAGPTTISMNSPGPAVARKHLLHRPQRAERRSYNVKHRTTYRYGSPVERSMHVFRLTPIHDREQTLLQNDIHVSVDGKQTEYEDVFGNRARRMSVETPYTELTVEATSRVELLDTDPLSFRPLRGSTTIPLVWMPWQRQVLQPFLLPEELPETQLHDLIEYGMSFVRRNEFDLLDTLLDLNTTIFREFAYQQGATTVHTTPYEVFANRRGVCQDFANLFICVARLLGVPARYVCGYLYAGPDHANQRQAEASHAWAQVYLPDVGWRGFDPTNGILTQTEHIRVAAGRNYIDATPTSGTIFVGGGGETLEVMVRVEPVG
jgi:transglutaminase-like putative cysteine protease/predicted glutamine amidotransferase